MKKDKNISQYMTLLLIRNTVTTVKKYGSRVQKFLVTLILVKEGFISCIGKICGRNNVGIKPYIEAMLDLYK